MRHHRIFSGRALAHFQIVVTDAKVVSVIIIFKSELFPVGIDIKYVSLRAEQADLSRQRVEDRRLLAIKASS